MGSITVMFQVTHGGYLDVDLEFAAPDGRLLHSEQGSTSGHYSFVANTAGTYRFCFSNQMSSVSSKSVTADIYVREAKTNEQKQAPDDSLSQQLRLLKDTAIAMDYDIFYLERRERAHQSTLESTSSRVYNWAMFEIVTLILMTFFQIFYLRTFFDKGNIV